MGALPNDDQPEGIDWRDIVFYTCMILLMMFAYFAQRWA